MSKSIKDKAILATRVLLALVLSFMCVSANMVSAFAEGEGQEQAEHAEPVQTCKKISAKAYPINENGKWVTSDGKKSKIAKNGGQLRIAVSGVWEDGVVISETEEQDWSDKGAFSEGFKYEWEGDCLTVGPTGVITALDNGTTEIIVTPQGEQYGGLSATLNITTANQGAGLIVTDIEIVKENGKAYGDDNIRFTDLSSSKKLYVRVTYVDKEDDNKKVVYSNYPDAPAEEKPEVGAFDTLSWTVADENYCKITSHDGVATIKAIASATTQVFASITGGDTTVDKGMGAGVKFDTVGVSINNGKTVNNGNPADKLKVKVVYEKDKDNVVKKKTYTVDEFEALGAVTRCYTLTRGSGGYATDQAYGVPIATLLMELGIDVNDIAYFTLAANDGANPGKISAKWLLKTTRYYFPNYDIGGSIAEREQVPSMLALEDAWSTNSQVVGDMNSGTRFRLVFGSATTNDSATDKSIKFINTFTIVLSGAPPSEDKKDKDPSEGSDDEGGSGNQGGSGGGAGGGKGKAQGQGESGGSESKGNVTQGGGQESKKGDKVTADDLTEVDAKTSWRIYQMMNKSNSDVDVVYEENPLEPFAIPAIILLLLAAAAVRFARFKKAIRSA